jgi:Methyltransferase domain
MTGTGDAVERVGPVQIAVAEQITVLTELAKTSARPGCRFLEIGSWCGDSAVVLARVAQEHSGHLFCIDWWRGNPGTELAPLAATHDVFSMFWRRIVRAGFGDVVIPIRGPSSIAAEILRDDVFDLIYIDADHRYESIRADIAGCRNLVRAPGGILSGDDCEGRLSDFDRMFLEAGKATDFHETVHCGVVLAVGEAFEDYSIDYSIWSVGRGRKGWQPTQLVLPGVPSRRQARPPLLSSQGSYNFLRYGRFVYAVPHSAGAIDITDDEERERLALIHGENLDEVKAKIANLAPDS